MSDRRLTPMAALLVSTKDLADPDDCPKSSGWFAAGGACGRATCCDRCAANPYVQALFPPVDEARAAAAYDAAAAMLRDLDEQPHRP